MEACKSLAKSKVLNQNRIVSSSEMAFMSSFSTTGVDANNISTIRLTLRSRIRFVIVIALTNFFKTLTTHSCLCFSTHFFVVQVLSTSGIAISSVIEKANIPKVKIKLSLICDLRLIFQEDFGFSKFHQIL